MKTWEMIKELTEKPEKEFISYARKGDRDVLKAKSVNGAIRFSDEKNRWNEPLVGVDLGREWEEVKKPVDFITAIKSGKRIRVEHEELIGEGWKKYEPAHVLIRALAGVTGAMIKEIIICGKWYIEG